MTLPADLAAADRVIGLCREPKTRTGVSTEQIVQAYVTVAMAAGRGTVPAEMAVLACSLLRQVWHERSPREAEFTIALGLNIIDLAEARDRWGEGDIYGHDGGEPSVR